MREVGAFEAKNTLSALLDEVERGEEVTITRHGREVARLVPPRGVVRRDAARDAASRIRQMRKGVNLRGIKPKELIDEGRL